jgi:hypothetical protein
VAEEGLMDLGKAMKGYGAYKAYQYMSNTRWAKDASDLLLERMGLRRKHPVSSLFGGIGLFALGLAIGGAVGVVLTPINGREMRRQLRERGMKMAEKTREMAQTTA